MLIICAVAKLPCKLRFSHTDAALSLSPRRRKRAVYLHNNCASNSSISCVCILYTCILYYTSVAPCIYMHGFVAPTLWTRALLDRQVVLISFSNLIWHLFLFSFLNLISNLISHLGFGPRRAKTTSTARALIFIEFHRYSLSSIDFHIFSLHFIYFH